MVEGRLDMDRDPVCPGPGERIYEEVRLGQHQARVQEELRAVAPERGERLGAEGEGWNEMPVPHVQVQPLKPEPRRDGGALGERAVVACQERGREDRFIHGRRVRSPAHQTSRTAWASLSDRELARSGRVLNSDWSWSLLVPKGTEPRPLSVNASRWTSTIRPSKSIRPVRLSRRRQLALRCSVNLRASPTSSSRLAALNRL